MSIERVVLMRTAVATADHEQLINDIIAAEGRAQDAVPGDRVDVCRYEALSTQLEVIGREAWLAGGAECLPLDAGGWEGHSFYYEANASSLPPGADEAHRWIAAGDIAIELRLPFGAGRTPVVQGSATVAAPRDVWRAVDARGCELDGAQAVAARFRNQIEAALEGELGSAITPSGVSNRVLTETLRAYAMSEPNWPPLDVPVLYQDGSYGPAFPLRCIDFSDSVPDDWARYHFAMLSIRHTELDAIVDGAWLRNIDISQARPAGDTDRLAYEQSREQFELLTATAPAVVCLYQTGLQPAVMGIYRAALHHMLERPGTLAVVPMYFTRQDSGASGRKIAGYRQQGVFEESRLPWVR